MKPGAEATRRDFLTKVGCASGAMVLAGQGLLPTAAQSPPAGSEGSMRAIRETFPELRVQEGMQYAYLDNAATTLRPQSVIDSLVDYYTRLNANPGSTLHRFARKADEVYEGARASVARFLHAQDAEEIVFTRGTTEAINVVASAWGTRNIHAGDEIVLTIEEHYSNLVPWLILARRKGARLRYLDISDDGRLQVDRLGELLTARTKLVAFTQVSNVLGIINDAREICAKAHAAGAKVLVDGAQAVPHLEVDVQALGCDFFAFSGHKIMGPMGIGVLWARRELLEEMPPYQAGSNMVHNIKLRDPLEFAHGAHKFGAGTPNVSGAVGLAAAIQVFEQYGRRQMWAHEQTLTTRMLERLGSIPCLRVLGDVPAREKISLFSFIHDRVPSAKLVRALDGAGFAVRAGDLAALPLLERLGVKSATRASLYIYNDVAEVERFATALGTIHA